MVGVWSQTCEPETRNWNNARSLEYRTTEDLSQDENLERQKELKGKESVENGISR
jgi:hypothetical protein